MVVEDKSEKKFYPAEMDELSNLIDNLGERDEKDDGLYDHDEKKHFEELQNLTAFELNNDAFKTLSRNNGQPLSDEQRKKLDQLEIKIKEFPNKLIIDARSLIEQGSFDNAIKIIDSLVNNGAFDHAYEVIIELIDKDDKKEVIKSVPSFIIKMIKADDLIPAILLTAELIRSDKKADIEIIANALSDNKKGAFFKLVMSFIDNKSKPIPKSISNLSQEFKDSLDLSADKLKDDLKEALPEPIKPPKPLNNLKPAPVVQPIIPFESNLRPPDTSSELDIYDVSNEDDQEVIEDNLEAETEISEPSLNQLGEVVIEAFTPNLDAVEVASDPILESVTELLSNKEKVEEVSAVALDYLKKADSLIKSTEFQDLARAHQAGNLDEEGIKRYKSIGIEISSHLKLALSKSRELIEMNTDFHIVNYELIKQFISVDSLPFAVELTKLIIEKGQTTNANRLTQKLIERDNLEASAFIIEKLIKEGATDLVHDHILMLLEKGSLEDSTYLTIDLIKSGKLDNIGAIKDKLKEIALSDADLDILHLYEEVVRAETKQFQRIVSQGRNLKRELKELTDEINNTQDQRETIRKQEKIEEILIEFFDYLYEELEEDSLTPEEEEEKNKHFSESMNELLRFPFIMDYDQEFLAAIAKEGNIQITRLFNDHIEFIPELAEVMIKLDQEGFGTVNTLLDLIREMNSSRLSKDEKAIFDEVLSILVAEVVRKMGLDPSESEILNSDTGQIYLFGILKKHDEIKADDDQDVISEIRKIVKEALKKGVSQRLKLDTTRSNRQSRNIGRRRQTGRTIRSRQVVTG